MNKYFLLGALLFPLFVGCATTKRPEPEPLTQKELQDFFGRAQDPRRFWITTYESDQGPVFTGAHRLHEQKFAIMPFVGSKKTPVPIIAVSLRAGADAKALIDTTARSSWMSYDLSRSSGNIPLGPPGYRMLPVHVLSAIPGYLTVTPRLKLEELQVDTALVYTLAAHGPPHELWRGEEKLDVHLILGNEFLRAFYFVQFDNPGRVVRFSTTTPYKPVRDRLLATVPMIEENGIVTVDGYIDSHPVRFLLDSVGHFSVATDLNEPMTAKQVMVGDLVLRQVPVSPSSTLDLGMLEFARLGRTLLNHFIVTLDYHQRLVHFERP